MEKEEGKINERKKRKRTVRDERKAVGRQAERGACWVFCADAAAFVARGDRLAVFHLSLSQWTKWQKL